MRTRTTTRRAQGRQDVLQTNAMAESDEQEAVWKDDDFLSFANTGHNQQEKQEEDGDDDESSKSATRSSDDMDESSSSVDDDSDDTLPPWMDRHAHRHVHPLTALHNEIVQFCQLMEPLKEEVHERDKLVARVQKLVRRHFDDQTEVLVFGSQATGLFLPSSDIDVVIITPEANITADEAISTKDDEYMPITSPIQRFASALRQDWLPELSYLEVLDGTSIPLVKFTHALSNVSFDVSFNQPHGPPAAQLMKTYLEAMPPLRPLTFVLKYFLAARGLNEPYTGGIGSFLLQLMIVALLQHRERFAVNFQKPSQVSLGSILLEFFELYGLQFNYVTTGISVRNGGSFFAKGASNRKENFYQPDRPFSIAMEDPLQTTVDDGRKSFRMQVVSRSFGLAYRTLLSHMTEPKQPTHSLLSTILPVNDEMKKRLESKRQHRLKRSREANADTSLSRKREKNHDS